MTRALIIFVTLVILYCYAVTWYHGSMPAPAKTETLSCVRVKQVTPAGTINYLCEVRK